MYKLKLLFFVKLSAKITEIPILYRKRYVL